MKTKLFIAASCIGMVLGGAGFFAAQWSFALFSSDTEDSEVHVSSIGRDSQHTINKPTDVQELVSEEKLLVRNIKLRKQLDGLDISQLLQLLEQSIELEEDQNLADVQSLLIESIARIDPEIALDRIWQFKFDRWNSLVSSVFTEWTSLNPDHALQTAATLMGNPRRTAIKTILETVSDTAAVLKIAESIGIVKDVEFARIELEVMQSLHDPHRAFDIVFSDTLNDVEQERLLITVAESWASREGSSMFYPLLDEIIERFETTRENDRETLRMLSNVVAKITRYHPESMWKLVLSKSAEIRNQFASPVLVAWGRDDFEKALRALERLDDVELQGQIYRSLFRAEAIRAPLSVLNNLNDVSIEHRRSTIAWAIRQLFRKQGAQDAIVHLTTLKEQGESVELATRFLIEEWAKQDVEAAVAWILSTTEEDDLVRASLLDETLSELSQIDPHQALEIAQANSSLTTIPLEASVLYYVSLQGDIETVKSLLKNVSNSERRVAYQQVGKNLIYFNQLDEAAKLVDDLPSKFQIEYFEELALAWFRERSETLVATASKLSNENARALAKGALPFNALYPRLTEQEVEELKSYITDE
ncbi:MAG: hypothetical protein F4227_10160 [Gammaproteobacteria bacterium]|nr:hypothetical protein [Gammaproteobacteria bacterium]MYF03302.1 hypothetical protein [Gammaproteobacteria bacterium]MYI76233.1 hypothetical protein [Gammaproteobacteria bacterium]